MKKQFSDASSFGIPSLLLMTAIMLGFTGCNGWWFAQILQSMGTSPVPKILTLFSLLSYGILAAIGLVLFAGFCGGWVYKIHPPNKVAKA